MTPYEKELQIMRRQGKSECLCKLIGSKRTPAREFFLHLCAAVFAFG